MLDLIVSVQSLRPQKTNHPETEARLRTVWREWADEYRLMPPLQAGKLDLLYRPANHRFAEPKTFDPSSLWGLR